MATFKLNGQDIPFEKGDSILRAAWRAGVEIPHYCWHPGLSVAANCRMCLVNIKSARPMAMPVLTWDAKKKAYVPDTKPKLIPACQADAAEGMEVDSVGEEVKNAQAHVQEFLLLNHPVDCPICDQAGECKLQDYYESHQATMKRKRTEPVHKPKAKRFGPKIVYDAERCISCTRCIRVCDELAKDHVLDMRERGNRNEIVVAPGRELDHDYSLMTEHVCPVGALTSRDFRFKARVWFLKSAPGVCGGCARGCNMHIDFDPRNGQVVRLRPRDNEAVNKYWMCDVGMMSYREVHQDRVISATAGRGDRFERLLIEEGVDQAVESLRGVNATQLAVVLSATNSTEDNHVLVRFAEKLGATRFYLSERAPADWRGDDILKHADPNPNRAGAEAALGRKPRSMADLQRDIESGDVKVALVLGEAPQGFALEKLDVAIVLASNESALSKAASVLLPSASWAEQFGSYVNADGLTQSFDRAVHPAEGVEPAWRTLVAMARALDIDVLYERTGDVRAAMSKPTSDAVAE